ncbi:fluoride efflux transporter CrcB [Polymorphum gilvum]|uniref:Fluoride-specific ion channel FluC n=1 Tax=Polymorphum gilvum (strain LMG 25793 / CGMCC 1.9160 / SL003B-26A1) TaxID=991905 RepID=F2IUX1_POLGS|nr:fluoride efflux transporter CrcB [Polymorphum gilvum]ADZ70200.1 crcB-like protein [Polymorphum gilvum SL003B-26A1]
MTNLLVVAFGGAAGAVSRHLVSMALLRLAGPGFPWGTLVVNVAGSLAMGVFIGVLARHGGGSNALRLLVATGFLGGFTTFSAFSLDFAVLWQRGETGPALAYAGVSVALSLLAVFAGLAAARALLS